MTTTTTNPGGKKLDVHQFFVNKPATQQSANPATSAPNQVASPPPVNGHGMPPAQFRPPGQPMMPQGQGQMRPQNGPYAPRPMAMMGQQPGMPQYPQHGGPQNPYMMQGYPGYSYYPAGYEQHYAPQWQQAQQQQHRQPNPPFGMSPRGSQHGLPAPPSQPSPAHPSAPLPGNGSISPAPTPPSRPHSLLQHPPPSSSTSGPSIPGTPGRPPSQPPSASYTPQPGPPPAFGLSGGAQSFTPRKSAAIQIRRPDGSVLDTKTAVASPASKETTGAGTPEEPAAPSDAAIKKKPFPVMVRIESEDAKKARLEEEATKERLRVEDEKYEAEKKERKARQAREAEEKRTADEAKAKDDAEKASKDAKDAEEAKAKAAEEQKKLDEAFKAEQAAAQKRDAEAAAVAQAAKESNNDAKAAVATAHAEAEAAGRKADEQRQSLLPPSSTPGSPLASPRLAAAGLPPKPTSGAAPAPAVRRAVPAPLDLKPSTPPPANDAQPSALSTAKPITDLNAVTYTAPIHSPDSTLNQDAQPGKFRYDRDFLMQFMAVCKEKPDSLPPLEEIGLEADSSSGFGKRGSRSSIAGTPRSGGTGLGIAGVGGQQRFPSQGMGSFGTGSFGAGQIGSLRGTTSEDRYRSSMANGRPGPGGRAASQQGMLPPMNSSSRMGNRASGRGQRRQPQATFANPEPGVQALQTTENAWVTAGRKLGEDDKRSPTFISRKVKALLNKLSADNFDSISGQVLEFVNYSVDEEHPVSMKLVIQLIFEKATDEAMWSALYARMCRRLMAEVDPSVTEAIDGKPASGGILFRKYLVGRCQVDFENGWKDREDAVLKAAGKSADDQQRLSEQASGKSAEPAVLSDEYYALQKAKRRGLGLIQLIGELFKLEMVNKNVMRQCFVKLLGHVPEVDEEDIESAVKLLRTIGPYYDAQSGENVMGIIHRLEQIREDPKTVSRIKFMIQDVIELQAADWKGKGASHDQTSTMTIAEVHQQAARDQAQQRSSTQQAISRAGSRAGQPRNASGNDWQTTPSQPRQSRPADFSNIGRISSSSAAPTFGPQSAFGRNRRGGAGQSTPPISRQASQANIPAMNNTNQFALLNDSGEAAESTEPAPQRKKLNLAPRTVPVEGEGSGATGEDDEVDDDNEESAEDDGDESGSQEMTETGAKAKIDLDMKELWGEKDSGGSRNPDDIVHYFRALPEKFQPLLAAKLYDEVFRTAKYKDAQIVAKGIASAVEEGVATIELAKEKLGARMVSLDDDAIDYPQAYKAVAFIMRSLSLSEDDISALCGQIDVYGEPKITPKMKIDRAIASVDEDVGKEA